MRDKFAGHESKFLLGCAALAVLFLLGMAALIPAAFRQDRHEMVYPDATPVFSRDNYSNLPQEIRWSDSYFSEDEFYDVRDWYIFERGLQMEDSGAVMCQSLNRYEERLLVKRRTTVVICETIDGQEISVTTATALR